MELVQGRLMSLVWTLSLRLLLPRAGSEETEEGSNTVNRWSRLPGEKWEEEVHIGVVLSI